MPDLNSPNFVRKSLVILTTVLGSWGAEYLSERWYYATDPTMGFDLYMVAGPLAMVAITCTSLLLGCMLLRRPDLLAPAIVAAFLGASVASPLVWGYLRFTGGYSSDDAGSDGTALQIMVLGLVPGIAVLLWLGWRATRRWVLMPVLALCYALVVGVTDWYVSPGSMFLTYKYDETAEDTSSQIDIEAMYLGQPALMQNQIKALVPQTPGKPETYALLLGGTAGQSVFRSEVEKVDKILAQRNGAGHSLRLVNDEENPMAYPMANRANLEIGLTALAKVMGSEDTAFLYLTSHGSTKAFSLNFYEAGTSDLTPQEFAAILKRSGLGQAVIVIGACHAGTFIPALQSRDRVIIAAARTDRTSFGCANGRDWTEFGQSFFDLALRSEPDPRKAFEIARKDIQRKEFWAWRRSSLPQMVVGKTIAARLDQLSPPS